jgi:hypothetical protein
VITKTTEQSENVYENKRTLCKKPCASARVPSLGSQEALLKANEELLGFNRLAVGRELRMIELKKEVNELCSEFCLPPRYPLEADDQIGTETTAA